MRMTEPFRKVRTGICLMLLTAHLGCATAPRPVASPQAYLQNNNPKRIWVTLTNGNAMVIDAPRVYGDSLLGFTRNGQVREEVWLPLSDLQEVRTRQVSGSKTALVTGAIAGAVGLILMIMPKGGAAGEKPCKNEGEPCEAS